MIIGVYSGPGWGVWGLRGKFLLNFTCKLKDFRLDFAGEARVCIPSDPALHLSRSAHDSNFVTFFRFHKA